MHRTKRALTALAAALILAIPAGAAAAQPSATDVAAAQQYCFSVSDGPERNPNVTGRQTVRELKTSRGFIELRSGYWKGDLVGWARVTGGNYWGIVMKVDLNGDRVVDLSCGPDGGMEGLSNMYSASASSDRAFKACVKAETNYNNPCHPDYQTGWW